MGRWKGSANVRTRQNAANEKRPSTIPRNNEITKGGPCARWDETERMIPSSGKTASKPLHVGPTQADTDVTHKVRRAPAVILPSRSNRERGAPAVTAEVLGKNDCPQQTAVTAAIEAQKGEEVIDELAGVGRDYGE